MYLTKLSLFVLIIVMISCNSDDMKKSTVEIDYPEVYRDSAIVDDYHGTAITDPYRWLEDDNSDETKAWVTAQNEVTHDFLSKIPFRDKVRDRLEQLWNYEKYSSPFKEAGEYYYFKNWN